MKMYFLLNMGIFQCHISFEGGILRDRFFGFQMVQKNSYSIIPSKHIESTLGPKLYKLRPIKLTYPPEK